MESEKNMGFRNAISGYNKTDVKEYISKMAEEAARREDAWDTERGKLLRAAENARAEQEAAEAQRDEMVSYTRRCQIKKKRKRLWRKNPKSKWN